MKIAEGNDKLGKNCFVVSRAVGDTCPSSCQFLGNGCYAEATEKRFPVARKAGLANMVTEWGQIRSLLLTAVKKEMSIRIHERGDFGQDDAVDVEYVNSWVKACESVVADGVELPKIWVYTHFYDSILTKSLSKYMMLYASVHNKVDIRKAKKAGFKRFAFIDTDHNFMPKKRKGGSHDAPKYVEFEGIRLLVCPEQRRGRKLVTCTGSKNTTACQWCLKGNDVAFIKH